MASKASPTLQEVLDEVTDLLEEALDPELTREEAIGKIKEALGAAAGEEDEAADEEEDDEDWPE